MADASLGLRMVVGLEHERKLLGPLLHQPPSGLPRLLSSAPVTGCSDGVITFRATSARHPTSRHPVIDVEVRHFATMVAIFVILHVHGFVSNHRQCTVWIMNIQP